MHEFRSPESIDSFPALSAHLSCRPRDAGWPGRHIRWAPLFVVFLTGFAVSVWRSEMALLAVSCFFAVVLLLRVVVLLVGWTLSKFEPPTSTDVSASHDLPIYSILIPLYQEAEMLPQILESMAQLDWPQQKLDIQLLIESDDQPTLDAAQRITLSHCVRVTKIFGAGPRTKPNALNVGLRHARGEFVCVFDAEDRPHPQQLRSAFEVFRLSNEPIGAVQAPLIGTRIGRSWIGGQWNRDYAVNFGLLLPAYARLSIPICLGGTSNHFHTRTLCRVGGWDAWNVTEDADLGLRLARLGLPVRMITVPTFEDAPHTLRIWLAQRTRWIKGFLMTWGVLMRQPGRAIRELGLWPFLSAQLTFGAATFSPFIYAPATVLVTLALWRDEYQLGQIGWAILLGGLGTSLLADLLAPTPKASSRWMVALTRFVYWPFVSIAAYGALIGLIRRPTYWAKTPHRPTPRTVSYPHDRLDT